MIGQLLKEFKPSLIFLAKFILLYSILTVIYSLYLNSFGRNPDSMTNWVTNQASFLLNIFVGDSYSLPNPTKPTVSLYLDNLLSVSIYEGCNGINMMIVFTSFILSFNKDWRKMLWFIPGGLIFIHAANLLRVLALAIIANRFPSYFYFFHKYLFTATIFIAIFILWYIWVVRIDHSKQN